MPRYDVVIIGAGPAGARAAELLSGQGRRVAVLEGAGPDRAKTCGGLLNRNAQQILADLGELPAAVRLGANQPGLEFPRLEYHDHDNRIRASYDAGYRNIDRAAFDAWLRRRAQQAGAEIFYHARVGEIRLETAAAVVRCGDRAFRAERLIDASGGRAVSRRILGIPWPRRLFALQAELELAAAPRAMWAVFQTRLTPFFSWVIPKGGRTCLAGTALPVERLRRLKCEGQSCWEPLVPLLNYLEQRGLAVTGRGRLAGAWLTWPAGARDQWWGRGRLLVVGEAAGLVSPHSGEGISYALTSAQGAAFAVMAGQDAAMLPRILTHLRDKLRLSGLRAWVGTQPGLRPWGLWFLPRFTGQDLTYLRWDADRDVMS